MLSTEHIVIFMFVYCLVAIIFIVDVTLTFYPLTLLM